MKNTLIVKEITIPPTGLCVVGDVHGDLPSLQSAIDHAGDRLIVFLGDIVDYGPQSAECFALVNDLVLQGRAFMVAGNHELKNYLYFTQRAEGQIRVQVKEKHMVSIRSFLKKGDEAVNDFLAAMETTPHIIRATDGDQTYVFVHGGVSRAFWNMTDGTSPKIRKSIIHTAFFGEVDGFLDDGFPNRQYYWTDYVPENTIVFMGHDPGPEVGVIENTQGGTVYQIDTGCSKGGFLSVAQLGNGKIDFASMNGRMAA